MRIFPPLKRLRTVLSIDFTRVRAAFATLCRRSRTLRACSAVRKLSRSVSRAICSTGLPVCLAISTLSRCAQVQDVLGVDLDVRRLALEAARAAGGSSRREFGSAKRLPFAPAASRNAPIDAAMPDAQRRHVRLDELHRVVDRRSPAAIEPPGELM